MSGYVSIRTNLPKREGGRGVDKCSGVCQDLSLNEYVQQI